MPAKTRTIRFAADAHDGRVALQVAPLIDIVFLLISFYLLVGQLVSNQKDAAVELPRMASPAVVQETPAEIVINLRQDGSITVGGRAVTLGELRAMLSMQRARAATAGRPLRVVVRSDRRQRFGRLDELLGACRQAGIKRVAFRSTRSSGREGS